MKIGLVRHFKVIYTAKIFMTSEEFETWAKEYDNSPIDIGNGLTVDEINWGKCFSSDLPRAFNTAKIIFNDEIIKTDLLREVPISPMFKTKLKLPFVLWFVLGRFAWFISHKSQQENKKQTEQRIKNLLSKLLDLSEKNILLVTHAFFIQRLQKELRKLGFRGRKIIKPKHNTLYIYEK